MGKKEFKGSKKIGRFHISGEYVRENPDEVALDPENITVSVKKQ